MPTTLTVVAEGIETEADLAWLAANGCDVGQGYFIARPMAADVWCDWMSGRGTQASRQDPA